MSIFDILDIGSSGLAAQRLRQEIISSNIANASTTRTPDGGPYVRKDVVFQTSNATAKFGEIFSSLVDDGLRGVRVSEVIEDESPGQKRFQPNHPDADAEGYVLFPNVNPISEMVNMVEATRSYEANLSVMNASKSMAIKAIDLGR
ncbi:MAG: flagellar basal body rod protein FlgC [Candidatus Coatesbacteria bacterium]|nr:flagellar basal body rod protein FlgC [Candidatus Coatesbacteria bacterium]